MGKITSKYIDQLKIHAVGQGDISYNDFLKLYEGLKKPKVNLVKIEKTIYVCFSSIPKASFKVIEEHDLNKFAFIKDINIVDIDNHKQNIISFLFFEFFQGDRWFYKLLRFVETISPIIMINLLLTNFATYETVQATFSALLTALSIFIATFTLFAINHDYWERKELTLFRNGKIAYYFSVDKNVATLGVIAIMTALLGVIIIPSDATPLLKENNMKTWIGVILINICLFITYIMFRTIIEFYVGRPAKFVLGELKKKSLETFD